MKSKQKQKNYTNIAIKIRKYKLHNLLTFYTLTLVMLTETHVHNFHTFTKPNKHYRIPNTGITIPNNTRDIMV